MGSGFATSVLNECELLALHQDTVVEPTFSTTLSIAHTAAFTVNCPDLILAMSGTVLISAGGACRWSGCG